MYLLASLLRCHAGTGSDALEYRVTLTISDPKRESGIAGCIANARDGSELFPDLTRH
jgi:hypothetical protein